MGDKREELLRQLWTAQDEAYDLMCEYDSLPHHYGAVSYTHLDVYKRQSLPLRA